MEAESSMTPMTNVAPVGMVPKTVPSSATMGSSPMLYIVAVTVISSPMSQSENLGSPSGGASGSVG